MANVQPRKKGKKRKAKNGEHTVAEEAVPEQSAGIANILKRYRSTYQEPHSVHVQPEDLAGYAAPALSGHELGGAKVHQQDAGVERIDDTAAAGPISENAHETTGLLHDDSTYLQASQSRPSQLEADEPGENDDDEGKRKSKQKQPKQASDAVLPWMRLPISITAGQGVQLGSVGGLDPRLRDKLHADGLVELYPVQTAAWQITAGGHSRMHDVCISAPTGSGKTLAYALPIVQGLLGRCVPQLRCLVVLPTRDLAAQVFKVFSGLCPAVGLRAGLAAAQASVAAEAAELFGSAPETSSSGVYDLAERNAAPVDILVATPGRLMAHLKGTPGATLKHLRYLVVDEADRLLRQTYQDWLPFVVAAAGAQQAQQAGGGAVLKLVASATLTRDPAKIERLGLHCPRYLALEAADTRYALPRSLKEYKLVCTGADKPLHAIALLQQLSAEPTVVFTASVEATRRLYVLLSAVPDLAAKAVEFSSRNTTSERSAALTAFANGEAKLLVASDAMTRGMDLPSVAAVVNYDAPVYPKTYIHRAGRTARAGRAGRVYTILRNEEVRHFKELLRKVNNTFVMDHKLAPPLLEAAQPACAHALEVLQAYLAAEGS